MIKLIESTVFKRSKTKLPTINEKTYPSMDYLIKVLRKSPISNHIKYNLIKHRECYIDGINHRTTMKIVDE